jgi:hypothetical protein
VSQLAKAAAVIQTKQTLTFLPQTAMVFVPSTHATAGNGAARVMDEARKPTHSYIDRLRFEQARI